MYPVYPFNTDRKVDVGAAIHGLHSPFYILTETPKPGGRKQAFFFLSERRGDSNLKFQGRKFHVALSMPVFIFIDTQHKIGVENSCVSIETT